MSEQTPKRQYGEKAEKQEEKDEKGRQEKNWDEKWRRDPLNAAVWAIILIWLGLVLLVSNIGLFDWIEVVDAWPVFFVGAGGILLLEALFRYAVPAYRAPVGGTLIVALIFLAIGLGGLGGWDFVWPLVIVAIGVSLLFRGLFRKRV